MASVVQQSINKAFETLGLAPSSTSTSTAPQTNGSSPVKVSSQEAISLEEEYSAHKYVTLPCFCKLLNAGWKEGTGKRSHFLAYLDEELHLERDERKRDRVV